MIDRELQADFIKKLRQNSRLSVRDFGEKVGVSGSYISQIEQGKTALSDKIYKQILDVYKDFTDVKGILKEDTINLPVKSEVTASMGYGVTVTDENQTGVYLFSKKLLSDIGANPAYSDIIFSSGDSMYPTIEGGDCLIVDKSKTDIHDGKIYCVRIEGQLYAKRLQLLPPKTILVISDNPKYKSFEVDFSKTIDFDFAIIGEVKWWSRVAK